MILSLICGFIFTDGNNNIISKATVEASNPVYTIPANVKKTIDGNSNDYVFKDFVEVDFSVVFPTNSLIEEIGSYSFFNCRKLKQIDFSLCTKLLSINSYAFNKCAQLSLITLPPNLINISNCFQHIAITTIKFPKSFKGINGFGPFAYTLTLETATFEEGSEITSFGSGFFKYTGLKRITIPKLVRYINGESFGDTNMEEFKVDSDNQYLVAFEKSLFTKNLNVLISYIKTTTKYHFPPQLTTIGVLAFGGNSGDLVFHENITEFLDVAFYQFRGEYIHFQGKVKYFSYRCFENLPNLKTLIIPEGIKDLPANCFYKCPKLKSLYLPFTLQTINDNAFDFTKIDCFYGNVDLLSTRLKELGQVSTKCFFVGKLRESCEYRSRILLQRIPLLLFLLS